MLALLAIIVFLIADYLGCRLKRERQNAEKKTKLTERPADWTKKE